MEIRNRDLDLMYEIGTLRFVPRMWRQFLNKDFANLAEHSLRVVWISLLISKYEGLQNTDKLVKMALVHDVAESRTGDVHYLSRQYVDRYEDKAIQEIFDNTVFEEEFKQLISEYENRLSIEAQIVKDADNLDVDIELKEQSLKGYEIPQWHEMREYVYANKLYTETAKSIWRLIQSSSPHEWHLNANNRFKAGDWTKEK